jgi:lipopolysaccharide export system protein LptC
VRISAARLFPLVLMFALALLTFYLERAVRVDQQHPSLRRHDPDYLLHHFTTTTYDRDGAAQSVLSADKMVHYPDDDSTELTAPRMVQTRAPGARFTVTAERGVLSPGGDEIFLYGNVVLVREADALRPRTRVTTGFLHVLQERALARTDQPVSIEEERRTITGRGMEFNNETSEFLLRNDVRVRLEPRQTK